MTAFVVWLIIVSLVFVFVEILWDRSILNFLLMRGDCNIRIRFREFLESYRVSKDRWMLCDSRPFADYGDKAVSFTTIAGYLRYRRFVRKERRRKKRREWNDETEGFRATLRQDILEDLDTQYKKWMDLVYLQQEASDGDPKD